MILDVHDSLHDQPAEPDTRPNYEQPAPRTHASAFDLNVDPNIDLRWYLPDWSERLRLMGWRNLLFLLPIGLFVGLLAFPYWWPAMWQLTIGWWKIWVAVIALPLAAAANSARNALNLRSDPFCIHCGYSLIGLANGHPCPECGQPCNHAVSEEYKRDPHWFIERYKKRHELPPQNATIMAGPVRGKQSADGT